MTQKVYKYGKHTCKAYKKPAGKGYEVGITLAGKPVFFGNFIHSKETATWWNLMNKEIRKFTRKYSAAPHAPTGWTTKFLANHMYKVYYAYLDREFSKYYRNYTHAVRKDQRRYIKFERNLPPHYDYKTYPMRRSA